VCQAFSVEQFMAQHEDEPGVSSGFIAHLLVDVRRSPSTHAPSPCPES